MPRKKVVKISKIGERIKEIRTRRKLTQKELAQKIGSDGRTISMYERGKFKPAAHVLIALAKVLDISTDELLKENSDTKNTPFRDEELYQLFLETDQLPKTDRETIKKIVKLLNSQKKK